MYARGLRYALGLGLLGLGLGCDQRGSSPERSPAGAEAELEGRILALAPADDWDRSAYTGWTRAHYEAVFARVLLGFVDHRSPDGAQTRYPGGHELPAAMEGATRMLPALGAWLACPCNPDRVIIEGRELDVAAIARAIVVAGTDPANPDYWGSSPGGWDQREVEGSSVAEFLVHSRARIWDRLTIFEQLRIMAWLGPAAPPLDANWLAFQIVRNQARAALGYSVPTEALVEELDRLEADYVGDGFYQDGHRDRFDWYNAFVIHAELSFWRSLAGPEERERVERVARRTAAFLGHLPYLFDAQGRVAPIGRSLGYRSGVLASLHASVLAGDGFVAPGLARRISAGNLRFHVEAGMFGPDQVLTRGYHGEQPGVVEDYLRPGSQYLATRALSVLALAPDHAFWTAPEQPLPADLGDFVHAIPAVGWTLEHDADAAGLILHNAATSTSRAHHHDKYGKLGYPAQSWYASVSTSADPRPYDAAVVSATNGRFNQRRASPEGWTVAPGFAWQRFSVAAEQDAAGIAPHWIETAWLGDPSWVGFGGLHLTGIRPSPDEPARLYRGGYAIALGPDPILRVDAPSSTPVGFAQPWAYFASGREQPEWGGGAVLLAGLGGWDLAGRELGTSPSGHVLGGPAGYLGLSVDTAFADPRWFASLEALAPRPFDPAPILAAAPELHWTGSVAEIHGWRGTDAWVELGPAPIERTVELASIRATGPLRMLWVGPRGPGFGVVAVGVRELHDASGLLVRSGREPLAYVACVLEDQRLRCELDGEAGLRVPAGARTLRRRDATWSGVEPNWATQVELGPHTRWIDASDQRESRAVTAELVEIGD